jgi:hypothetical protein
MHEIPVAVSFILILGSFLVVVLWALYDIFFGLFRPAAGNPMRKYCRRCGAQYDLWEPGGWELMGGKIPPEGCPCRKHTHGH